MKATLSFSRVVSVALLAAILSALCCVLSTPRAQEMVLGDVSGDGAITSVDASMALQIANGMLTPSGDQRSAADADRDGAVTAADAEMILQCAAEKCSSFIQEPIGPDGGILSADELTIAIPPGALSEVSKIIIKTIAPYPIQYENLDALGSFYQLEPFPPIQRPITVEISFDPNVISTDASVYIYQEEMSYITGGVGETLSGRPRLDTTVDRMHGTATIQIDPSETYLSAAHSNNLIASLAQRGSFLSYGQGALVSFVGVLSPAELPHAQDSYFFVVDFTGSYAIVGLPAQMLLFLNKAYDELKRLNFSLDEGKKLPMAIYITNYLNSSEDNVPAEAVLPSYPAYQAYYSYINVKPGFSDAEYKVFLGHELFHIIQGLYGAYSTFKFHYQYLWLREASSTWFEVKVSDQGTNHFSDKARTNSTFIYAPLEKEDEDHGYGASAFLTYLTDRDEYGEGLIHAMYQKIKNEEDNHTGTGALQAALGGGEKLGELFGDFALQFISGTTGHANWPEPGPPPGGEMQMTPDQQDEKQINLPALSAWNIQVNPPRGFNPLESYKLVVSLKGGNRFIKGAVYARATASSPWQSACEFAPDETCVIENFFGSGGKRSANVILVNRQAEHPYNQVVPVTLTLKVQEQVKSIVGTWDVTKYDYLCQGFYVQTGELHIYADGTYTMYLSEGSIDDFEGTWFLKRESALGGDLMAHFYSNGEQKFQVFVNDTYDGIYNDWLMSGSAVVCVHAKKISDIP